MDNKALYPLHLDVITLNDGLCLYCIRASQLNLSYLAQINGLISYQKVSEADFQCMVLSEFPLSTLQS